MDDDDATWQAFIKNVTPLTEPKPSRSTPVLERVIASHRIDLHGLCLSDAHTATMNLLDAATDRSVTIVTGLSGAIKQEFPRWFDHLPYLRIEELHGGGSFRIHFRRNR
jgi:DNA-nicking Smr family endonuclease